MGRRISKEFLHPSILEGVNNKIGDLDSLETDAKGNMVQAINELVEKLDNSAEIENGKELIANAVGEPLTAEESFDEMSIDINSLLSTFKTNMMNNGITVESGDKFKQLIDKIATMVEEGSGKGIKMASGTTNYTMEDYPYFIVNTGFKPDIIFFYNNYGTNKDVIRIYNSFSLVHTYLDIRVEGSTLTTKSSNYFDYINETGFKTACYSYTSGPTCTWYAIGVGEDDTTLRDSLASILQEEGVSVTEEDDMSSLITKVDNKFTDIKQLLVDRAISKGISASLDEDYASLLNKTTTLTMVAGTSGNYLMTYFNKNISIVNVGTGSCTGTMEFDDTKFYIKSLSLTFTGDNVAVNVIYTIQHKRNGAVLSTIASGESGDNGAFTQTYTIEDVKNGDEFVLSAYGTGSYWNTARYFYIKGTAILSI